MQRLGLHGLDHLDAAILAALAAESPLLLIGPHGSAKSALLNRTAQALGLEHRHYNASLVSFDDLLGFPVPDEAREGLRYLRTPATLWGAQSVFLDEISRCRPEVQNKLFAIVHERRAMGIALESLRYRWAAMNPPAGTDGAGLGGTYAEATTDAGAAADAFLDDYLGSQPLDPALADRFAFVVALPPLTDIDPAARRRLIAEGDDWHAAQAAALPALIERARAEAAKSREAYDDWVVRWVDALVTPLAQAGWPISGRRAAMLRAAAHAVHGARVAVDGTPTGAAARRKPLAISDSALEALRWGLPQRAQGRPMPESRLLAVHRKAVQMAGLPADSPLARIEAEADPLKRVALALALPDGTLSRASFSSLVADAFAAQDLPGRYLLARRLLPAVAERDLADAPTLELLAGPVAKIVEFERDASHRMQMTRSETARFNALLAELAKLDAADPEQASLGNLLYTLFMAEQAVFEPKAVIARDRELAHLLCANDGATAGSDREEPAASSLAERAANDRDDRAAA
jgi:MoxR-like ATPase